MAFGPKLISYLIVLFLSQLLRHIGLLSALLDDSIDLDTIFLFLHALFDVQMLHLLGVEALAMVLLHASIAVDLLNKANHGFITF